MIRPIVRDVLFLSRKSIPATINDKDVAQDLFDTLKAHHNECVGMAANMIGVNKRIIVINNGPVDMIMYNPVIINKSGPFETEEACLSLNGIRKCLRYKEIVVEYQDMNFTKCKQKFTGWTAQIICHECDHLEGIIII